VRLDQRLEAEIQGVIDQAGQPSLRVEHGEQQHRVGAGGPQDRELARVDDELLGQDRH
jgi:hypothetical protein